MVSADTSWLFADDGRDFKAKMIDFIRANFSDVLGENVRLLDHPGGLESLRTLTREWLKETKQAPATA